MVGRLFSPKGKVSCIIQSSDGDITIRSSGKEVECSLNGCVLVPSCSWKKFISRCSYLVSKLMSDSSIVKKSKNSGKMVDELLDTLEKERGVKVRVLEEAPDEEQENSPRELKADGSVISKIPSYINQLNIIANDLSEICPLADSLIRIRLPDNMWGIKDIKHILGNVKEELAQMKPDLDKFDVSVESSEKKAKALTFFTDKTSHNVISGMIDDFFVIKGVVANLVQSLSPLHSMDKVFKEATGYPTTWVFNPSTYYDFQFCYDNLVKDLGKLASFELSTIEPLFVLKVQANQS